MILIDVYIFKFKSDIWLFRGESWVHSMIEIFTPHQISVLRYIPVGVLEQVPQRINERPPYYIGRNDLETLMASANCADWVKIR